MQQLQRNKYLETAVQTSSPAQLLIMLVDGAIRFCRAGVEGIRSGNYEYANTQLVKTQNIISEFMITIDRSSPIAPNLLRLYEYFNARLIQANIKKDAGPAEEILQYLIELKETWIQAAKSAHSTTPAALEFSHG